MTVPSLVPVTTSIELSLFRSVASTVEPMPEFVSSAPAQTALLPAPWDRDCSISVQNRGAERIGIQIVGVVTKTVFLR